MFHRLFFGHTYNPQLNYLDHRICGTCHCRKEAMGYTCRHMIYNGQKECGEWPS